MTKTAGNATLTIRCKKKQLKNWKANAARTGMSLSYMIRYVMDHTDLTLLMTAKRDEESRKAIRDEFYED